MIISNTKVLKVSLIPQNWNQNAGKNHNPYYVNKTETGLGLWFIYDSLNNVEFYASSIKPALKRINSETSSVLVMVCDINKKFGTEYCGLFALAYA
jgi:hypothetical protein